MRKADHRSRAAGVGVTYHPFLHDYILGRCGAFDFIELPLDLYSDPARAALLDPGERRLHQVVAAKPCVWRGTALSLGSADSLDVSAHTIRTIRRLLDLAQAKHYTDVIGYRAGGGVHAMPFTAAAACWIAQRQAAAEAALGVPVLLAWPTPARDAPAGEMTAAEFLAAIASQGGRGFVLDAGDPPCASQDVAALTLSSDRPADWERLEALATQTAADTIVLRRDRQLFPLDTITRDLSRTAQLLAQPRIRPVPATCAHLPVTPPDLAGLHHDPERSARAASAWLNWRTQVDDMHKAQQLMALMAKNTGPRAPWGA